MKTNQTGNFRIILLASCLAILLTILSADMNLVQAGDADSGKSHPGAPPKQSIDACELMPSVGRISSQSETSCVAQFSSTPAERVVQIQTQNVGFSDTARFCSGLLEPSDYHIMMKEAKLGDCGIQVEVSYQGTPMPGYTGWAVYFYYHSIYVRVASSESYPANQSWVYDTAREIEGIIDDYLGTTDNSERAAEIPDWIQNPEVQIEDWGEKIYIPGWLDWIEPRKIEDSIRAVVKPIEGEAWIYNRETQEWRGPAKTGEFLHSGEVIVVGDDSSMEVYVRRQGYIATATIADNASLAFVPDETVSDYPILWQLYSGLIKIKRDYTGEPLPYEPAENIGAEFSTVTTIRSEAVLSFDPDTKITEIYLIEGEIDYYNLIAAGPEDGSLISGEKLVIWGDGTEAVQPFDQSELKSFLAAHNFQETDPLDLEEIEKLLDGTSPVGDQEGEGDLYILYLVIGLFCCFGIFLVIGGVAAILVIQSRKKKSQQG